MTSPTKALLADCERLHGLAEQIALRFKGYLPWPEELRTGTVRSHERAIEDTIKRADELLARLRSHSCDDLDFPSVPAPHEYKHWDLMQEISRTCTSSIDERTTTVPWATWDKIHKVLLAARSHTGDEWARGMEEAAGIARDQTSDDPPPGNWNGACEYIERTIRSAINEQRDEAALQPADPRRGVGEIASSRNHAAESHQKAAPQGADPSERPLAEHAPAAAAPFLPCIDCTNLSGCFSSQVCERKPTPPQAGGQDDPGLLLDPNSALAHVGTARPAPAQEGTPETDAHSNPLGTVYVLKMPGSSVNCEFVCAGSYQAVESRLREAERLLAIQTDEAETQRFLRTKQRERAEEAERLLAELKAKHGL